MIFTKIKKMCKEKGISVYRLRKDLGFTEGTMEKWDGSMPGADKLLLVAKYFEVPIEYFLEEQTETKN